MRYLLVCPLPGMQGRLNERPSGFLHLQALSSTWTEERGYEPHHPFLELEDCMPIITIKVFEGELTWSQVAEMIEDITQAVIPFFGEAVRSSTRVLIEEVKSGGLGNSKALGLPDLQQIKQNAPPDLRPYSSWAQAQPARKESRHDQH